MLFITISPKSAIYILSNDLLQGYFLFSIKLFNNVFGSINNDDKTMKCIRKQMECIKYEIITKVANTIVENKISTLTVLQLNTLKFNSISNKIHSRSFVVHDHMVSVGYPGMVLSS